MHKITKGKTGDKRKGRIERSIQGAGSITHDFKTKEAEADFVTIPKQKKQKMNIDIGTEVLKNPTKVLDISKRYRNISYSEKSQKNKPRI